MLKETYGEHPLFVRLGTLFVITALLTLISVGGAFTLTRFVNGLSAMIDQAQALQDRCYQMAAQLRGATADRTAGHPISAAARNIDDALASPVFAPLRRHGNSYAPTAAFNAVDTVWRDDVKPKLVSASAAPQAESAAGAILLDATGIAPPNVLPSLDKLTQKVSRLTQALGDDIAAKQSEMLWLQLACLVCALLGAAMGIRDSHTALVQRLARLFRQTNATSAWRGGDEKSGDEIERLTVVLKGLRTDLASANENRDALAREVRANFGRKSLNLLFNVNQWLNDAPLSEATLLRVLSELQKTIGADAGTIHLDEKASQHWHFNSPITSGETRLNPAQTRYFEQPAGDWHIGTYDLPEHGDAETSPQCLRALTMPLKQQDRALGVVMLEAGTEFQFEEWQIQLVELVSRHIAVAIGNVNLAYEGRRIALMEERAAIARELHDSIAQSLSYMKIQILRLERMYRMDQSTEEIGGVVEELREGFNGAYRKLRELLTTFRVKVSERGLGDALQETITEFGNRSGLTLTLDNRLHDGMLTSNEEIHVLQTIREALSNVVRHAHATRAVVALEVDAHRRLSVAIDDNGIGLGERADSKYHHGMVIMQERVNSLGGKLRIENCQGGGTRVEFSFTPSRQSATSC